MAKKIVIHPSTLNRLACRLQYHWSRKYKTTKPADHLTFGLCIHEALEYYYERGADPIKVFQEAARKSNLFLSMLSLGEVMLTNYLDHYKGNEDFKVLSTEQEAGRLIPRPVDESPEDYRKFYVAARIDAIVLDRKIGKIFVLEHKTFDKFYPASLEMDHQFVLEKFIADGIIGKPIAGVLYNGLRKAEKAGRTTKLFERHPLYINQNQVDVALHRAYWSLKMIHDPEGFKIYPEPSGLKCNMCDFKQPCTEYIRGGDYKFILENLFENKSTEGDNWE